MALLDIYNSIFRDENSWKYYSRFSSANPFLDDNARAIFIEDYFIIGGKEQVLYNISLNDFRKRHTLSVFFLGIYLNKMFGIKDIQPDFRYMWFLTCLYHDYGYYYEEDNDFIKNSSYNELFNRLGIEYRIPTTKRFNEGLVRTYYDYFHSTRSVVNHGIVGGILLYDRLKKNFNYNFKEAKRYNIDVKKKDFYYNDLHWSSKHQKYYKQAALAIIKHNIWFAYDEVTKREYMNHGLSSLVINKKTRIKYNSNPFLFLLYFADTIEPTKFFNTIDILRVLEGIDINYISSEFKINISILDSTLNYEDWFKKIIEMEKWLNIKIKRTGTLLEIIINK